MVVDRSLAEQFIQRYKNFLLFVYDEEIEKDEERELLQKLSSARERYDNNRELFSAYLDKSKNPVPVIDEAIDSLELSRWVYLKDTTKYSLFIKSDETASLAVLGLTQPIKEIFGYSGMYMKTGIIRLGNYFVCDGLVAEPVQLGKHFRDQFNLVYRELKQNGAFYKLVSA